VSDKLNKQIRELEEEHAAETVESHLEAFRQEDHDRAMFILGGVNIADKIATSLNAEAIKALITFQEQKLHEALGFETFVAFLNESEYSPMSKQQFYDRKAILEKEGEKMFDLLTELGVSMRKRKLLGKGSVEIVGDIAIVHDGGETTEIQLTDRTRLLETLTALADANAEKSIKLERQKEMIDKHADEKRDLYEEMDRVRASKAAPTPDDHMIARVELGLSFTRLRDSAAGLSEIEKDQFRDSVLEDVAGWTASLREAYKPGTAAAKPAAEAEIVGETFDDALTNFLDKVDLDDVANDGELAAQL